MRPLRNGALRLQRRDDIGGVGAAQRHDKRGGVAQIGTDLYLGHRDIGVVERRIAQLARPQQLGEGVAQLLADAQLALGRFGSSFRMFAAGPC